MNLKSGFITCLFGESSNEMKRQRAAFQIRIKISNKSAAALVPQIGIEQCKREFKNR